MSKIDSNIISNLKILNKNVKNINLDIIDIFYNLFKTHLNYDMNNFNYINKDKLVVSKKLEPILNTLLPIFYVDKNVKYEYSDSSNPFAFSNGLALGERYLNNLLKIEQPKNNLINYHTFNVCKYDDLLKESSFDSIIYSEEEKFNKLIYIVIKDQYDVCKYDLLDRFLLLNFNVEEINGISKLNSVLEDAKISKKPSIIFVKLKNNNKLTAKTYDMKNEEIKDLQKIVSKRLNKELGKWHDTKTNAIKDLKIKEIIDFLESKKITSNFKATNIKISNDYEERLIQSNNKILNILTSKTPFILCCSDDFDSYLGNINKSKIMSKENPLGRNILFNERVSLMSGIACGLSSIGFKIFLSTSLDNIDLIKRNIKYSVINNLNIHYILIENDNTTIDINEVNSIHDLLTFRPCDINEIIGVYEILKNYPKPTVLFISNEKIKVIKDTHYKYVQAGAYPVRKEKNNIKAIIIASGNKVNKAIVLANLFEKENIGFRVVSMVSPYLFKMQNEKYQKTLLNSNLKVFYTDPIFNILNDNYLNLDDLSNIDDKLKKILK